MFNREFNVFIEELKRNDENSDNIKDKIMERKFSINHEKN
jgi:hypothetical protein